MNTKRDPIKIVTAVSLISSIISGIFLGIIVSFNVSWSYFLTNNHEEQMSGTSISSNGEYFVVGSGNDRLYLFKRTSSKPLWIWRANCDIPRVDISSDSNFIIAGTQEYVVLFEKVSPKPIWNLTTGNAIVSVAISSDGDYSAICIGKNLYLYQRTTSTLLINGANSGDHVEVSSDGNYIASFDFFSGLIYLFNKSSSTPMWQYSTGDVLWDIAITHNGEYIITGGQASGPSGYKIFLFNRTSPIPKIMYADSIIKAVAISRDGDYIAVGCGDGIYLFNSSSLTRIWKFSFPIYGETHSLAISSDADTIVANLWRDPLDGEIRKLLIFNKLSSNPIITLNTKGMVNEIAISSNGYHISVATQQNAYYINPQNPIIDDLIQLKLDICYISLGSSLVIGIVGILTYTITNSIKETRIEKEARKKEVSEVIDTLDKKYEEWEDKEREEDKI